MDVEVKIKLNDPSLLRQQCYVNGAWMDAASGDVIEVDNPATGEVVATVPSLSASEGADAWSSSAKACHSEATAATLPSPSIARPTTM